MSFFSEANRLQAKEIVARYPRPKSAILPLAHLAQDQEGWLSVEAMNEIGEASTIKADLPFESGFGEILRRVQEGNSAIRAHIGDVAAKNLTFKLGKEISNWQVAIIIRCSAANDRARARAFDHLEGAERLAPVRDFTLWCCPDAVFRKLRKVVD